VVAKEHVAKERHITIHNHITQTKWKAVQRAIGWKGTAANGRRDVIK
jgi:hypothetical protein